MRVSKLALRCAQAAAWASVCGALTPADAMNVSPMVVELSANGARSTGRIQVINVLKQPLPYEVRVYRINFGQDDKLVETAADSDFLVFPPQGLLQTNDRQMIRVQWVGGPLDSSRGYYVAIDQLPVAIDAAEANKHKASVDVQIVYHMKVLVTVAPPGSSPKLSVESAHPVMVKPPKIDGVTSTDAPAVPGVEVTVRNSGKRYAMMAGAAWTIQGKGTDGKPLKVVLTSDQMGRLLGAGYVPALNGRRTFDIPTGTAFSNAPITVKFSN